ncbi:MAG TPA: histone deacetylase family protein [Acidimicrobiia bacterium]
MILTAIWSQGSLAHDPGREVWIGIPIEGDETPARGNAMKAGIDAAGLRVASPGQHPDGPILAVHDSGMLAYLKTAYADWVAAGYPEEHGQDRVVAYAFRHPGAFDHAGKFEPRSRAARAGNYCFDTCTTIGPGTYRGIRYAVDASLTAADLVLSGSGNAYAAVRPPGHHAGTDYFGGSCYLNNAAITAQYLIDNGATRVGIIDIDAHHGNGTQQVFYERSDVVYASVHIDPGEGWFPHWSGFGDETGSGGGAGFNMNVPLASRSGDEEFVSAVERSAEFVGEKGCDSLVVSLGVDAGVEDENSPLDVTADGFGLAGVILAQLELPTVLVQEGGYHLPSLERDLTAILSRFSSTGR